MDCILLDMDCSLPGSSLHGISQAKTLEWVAISFSRGSSWPRDWTYVSCLVGEFLTIEPLGKPYYNHLDNTAGGNELNCSNSQIWLVEKLGHRPPCPMLKTPSCVCEDSCVHWYVKGGPDGWKSWLSKSGLSSQVADLQRVSVILMKPWAYLPTQGIQGCDVRLGQELEVPSLSTSSSVIQSTLVTTTCWAAHGDKTDLRKEGVGLGYVGLSSAADWACFPCPRMAMFPAPDKDLSVTPSRPSLKWTLAKNKYIPREHSH